mgnify:CR=1 FL=1
MIIDTQVFPYTDEYDINLYWDEDRGVLTIKAYYLQWEQNDDPDRDCDYILEAGDYDDWIDIATINESNLKAWDFFVSDHWTTRTAFEVEFAHLPMLLEMCRKGLEKLKPYEAFLP